MSPKSRSAARRASAADPVASKLPGCGSPWIQSGGPACSGAARARSKSSASRSADGTEPRRQPLAERVRPAGERNAAHRIRRGVIRGRNVQREVSRGQVGGDPGPVADGHFEHGHALQPRADRPRKRIPESGQPRVATGAGTAIGSSEARASATTAPRSPPAVPRPRAAASAPPTRSPRRATTLSQPFATMRTRRRAPRTPGTASRPARRSAARRCRPRPPACPRAHPTIGCEGDPREAGPRRPSMCGQDADPAHRPALGRVSG